MARLWRDSASETPVFSREKRRLGQRGGLFSAMWKTRRARGARVCPYVSRIPVSAVPTPRRRHLPTPRAIRRTNAQPVFHTTAADPNRPGPKGNREKPGGRAGIGGGLTTTTDVISSNTKKT